MKHSLFYLLLFIFQLSIKAQNPICGTEEYTKLHLRQDTNYAYLIQKENKRQNILKIKNNIQRVGNADITIPVIVHIVYKNSDENLSNEIIGTAIDQLNADFNRLNNQSIPIIPTGVNIGTSNIQFCLQQIIRTYTTEQSFVLGGNIAAINTIRPPVDQSRCLNIYVSDLWLMQNGIAVNRLGGFTSLPPDITSSVYMDYNFFGVPGTNGTSFSHFVTHEVGHWLGLCHPWSDGLSYECPNDGLPDHNVLYPKEYFSCNNGATNYFMNFMEYSGDACINMFTSEQVSTMRSMFDDGVISGIPGPYFSIVDPMNLLTGYCSGNNVCNTLPPPTVDVSTVLLNYYSLTNLNISWTRVNSAVSYKFEYKLNSATTYISITTINPSVILSNLPSGTFQFRITPIFANCIGATSTVSIFSVNLPCTSTTFDINRNNNFLTDPDVNSIVNLIRPTGTSSTNSVIITDNLSSPTDIDWFRIKTQNGYTNFRIILKLPLLDKSDLELELYDCKGNLIREMTNQPFGVRAGTAAPYNLVRIPEEYITYNNALPSTDYYIKVFLRGTSFTTACYSIEFIEQNTPFTNN